MSNIDTSPATLRAHAAFIWDADRLPTTMAGNNACNAAAALRAVADEKEAVTYSSTQSTKCAECLKEKHTPLRVDEMGGYVCLTCIDRRLCSLLGEFGYPPPPGWRLVPEEPTVEMRWAAYAAWMRETAAALERDDPDEVDGPHSNHAAAYRAAARAAPQPPAFQDVVTAEERERARDSERIGRASHG